MRQYETFELVIQGEKSGAADVSATFSCGDREWVVKGFGDGEGRYVVRFLPEVAGEYTWKISGIKDCETGEYEGRAICEPVSPSASDKQGHGIVRADGLHFRYADGTWFKPFGTTVYALIHQEDELVETTMETLRNAPFNKVRFCIFPKHYDYNHNDPKYYPFEKTDGKWDVNKPCYEYWHALERRIAELDAMGIQCDLILFHPYDRWGFSKLGVENNLIYLDYLIRRLAAYPNVWWSMSNEFDLFDNLTIADWNRMTEFVAKEDPYHHLLSNHNCFPYWDFTQECITHCCIQDINVNEVPELQRKYGKPVIFDECRYEGNILYSWGNLSAREMTHRFWTATVYGGYCTHGETYLSEDDILWWSRGGVLKGESPARIAFLRQIVEELPGPLELVTDGLGGLTTEMVEDMKANGLYEEWKDDFFAKNLVHVPTERVLPFILRHRACFGHCGRDAYLRYSERECTAIGVMDLPEDARYRVEVIDTWEMTRTVALENACGHVQVDLPGKEGIAMLAIKVQ